MGDFSFFCIFGLYILNVSILFLTLKSMFGLALTLNFNFVNFGKFSVQNGEKSVTFLMLNVLFLKMGNNTLNVKC